MNLAQTGEVTTLLDVNLGNIAYPIRAGSSWESSRTPNFYIYMHMAPEGQQNTEDVVDSKSECIPMKKSCHHKAQTPSHTGAPTDTSPMKLLTTTCPLSCLGWGVGWSSICCFAFPTAVPCKLVQMGMILQVVIPLNISLCCLFLVLLNASYNFKNHNIKTWFIYNISMPPLHPDRHPKVANTEHWDISASAHEGVPNKHQQQKKSPPTGGRQ